MRDPRFLPIEMREPAEEYEDEFLTEEEAYESFLQGKQKKYIKKVDLYIAS